MAEKKKKEEMTIEAAMARMEEIQEIIRDGEISLNKSVELFEEAAKLYSFCDKSLTELENRVKILSKNSEGGLSEIPFEMDEQ